MLHLVYHSNFDKVFLQRMESGDTVVFFENAVYSLFQRTALVENLSMAQKQGVCLFVMAVDLELRGIKPSELISAIEVIEYADLVELTERYKVIKTWV